MPRQSNGQYVAPANTAAISGQSVSSTAFNTLETDIGTEITNSVDRGGRSAMQAALPMGGQKITGMADPTIASDGATKSYVDTTTASFFSTGDVKMTLKAVADTGWVLFDDGTIGSATSGSTSRANADTQALFTLFFNNMSNTASPILTAGGAATTRAAQVNAATAWAANCRISLPKTLGRALGVAGLGAGLTQRNLGDLAGSEIGSLTTANLPAYTPSGSIANGAISTNAVVNVATAGSAQNANNGALPLYSFSAATISQGASTFTGAAQGGTSTPFNIMQPSTFLNAMIKL